MIFSRCLIPSPYLNPGQALAWMTWWRFGGQQDADYRTPYEADAFRRPQLYPYIAPALKNTWNVLIVAVLVVVAIPWDLILQSLGDY